MSQTRSLRLPLILDFPFKVIAVGHEWPSPPVGIPAYCANEVDRVIFLGLEAFNAVLQLVLQVSRETEAGNESRAAPSQRVDSAAPSVTSPLRLKQAPH